MHTVQGLQTRYTLFFIDTKHTHTNTHTHTQKSQGTHMQQKRCLKFIKEEMCEMRCCLVVTQVRLGWANSPAGILGSNTDNADWCLRCKTRRSTLCKSSGVLLKFQVKPQAESQATSRATSRRFQPPVNSTRVHHHHPDPFIKSNKKLCIPLPKSQYKCAKLGDYDIKISAT